MDQELFRGNGSQAQVHGLIIFFFEQHIIYSENTLGRNERRPTFINTPQKTAAADLTATLSHHSSVSIQVKVDSPLQLNSSTKFTSKFIVLYF